MNQHRSRLISSEDMSRLVKSKSSPGQDLAGLQSSPGEDLANLDSSPDKYLTSIDYCALKKIIFFKKKLFTIDALQN